MAEKPERFDIPSSGNVLEVFRAIRAFFETVAEEAGQSLEPEWYADAPEDRPGLYPQHEKESRHEE